VKEERRIIVKSGVDEVLTELLKNKVILSEEDN